MLLLFVTYDSYLNFPLLDAGITVNSLPVVIVPKLVHAPEVVPALLLIVTETLFIAFPF